METTTEPKVTGDTARAVLQREYMASVNDHADSILEAIADGEITDTDGLETRLHEDVDGSEHVIYYGKAALVCYTSDNDEAIFEEMGGDALKGCDSMGAVYCRVAYYALMRDIREAFDYRVKYGDDSNAETRAKLGDDFDIGDDSTWPANRDSDEDEAE